MSLTTPDRPVHQVDISSDEFWSKPPQLREESFAKLRQEPTLTWHAPLSAGWEHDERGVWAAVTLADIRAITRNHRVFSNTHGISVAPAMPGLDEATAFFLAMDPPQHTVLRKLVSAAFTPKAVAQLHDRIASDAKDIVEGLHAHRGRFDFVRECSAKLPMRTVSDMIGIAEEDRPALGQAASNLFAGQDSSTLEGEDKGAFAFAQIQHIHAAAVEVAVDRRKNPRDDLVTAVVQAEVDGRRLSNEELGAFMVLLTTAGYDTTKQTTSHAMWWLSQNPEQLDWLKADFDDRISGAVEEIIRYATPVIAMSRVALEDTEIRGARIRAGERVGMFYCSANRDESEFEDPNELRLDRYPNQHVGFGGGGVHFCLGNTVARTQLKLLLKELLFHGPKLEFENPDWLHGSFINGIKSLMATPV